MYQQIFFFINQIFIVSIQEHHADDIWHPEEENNSNILNNQKHEFGLGPKWAEEYIEHSIDAIQSNINIENPIEIIENNDNPNFEYSKFMKFMKQEGEIPIENNQDSLPNFHDTSKKWIEQYKKDNQKSEDIISSVNRENEMINKVEEELAVAGNWIDEFQKENVSTGLQTF